MSLKIVRYPSTILRQVCHKVDVIDDYIKELAKDMLTLMYAENGVGLSAPQVGTDERLIVVDVSETKNDPIVMVNPEILNKSNPQFGLEGCLSFKGIFENVKYPGKITVKYTSLDGNLHVKDCVGLLAQAVSHEIDHLDGVLFIDRMDVSKQTTVRKKLLKPKGT